MITNNIKKIVAGAIVGSSLLMALTALPVGAQTVGVDVSASSTVNVAARLSAVITKANSDIAARITDLNNLNTKVQAMVNVSASEKTSISNEVQTNITGLTALQAKIDADTVLATAKSDAATIFTTFRIYALVIPQGYIEVSADKVNTISSLMTSLSTKLQARITADQNAGDNVASLQTALTDISTQTTNANSQAGIAQSGVVNLTPDQGNKTTAASNQAALVAARANIKTASADLKTARQDIQTILDGLKSFHATISASTTAQ